MGLFEFFKKKNDNQIATSDNGLPGPTYLESLTEPIVNPENLLPHEWRRQLKAQSGQTKFRIRYYGKLHNVYHNLIVATDFAPALIYAVDDLTGQEILLFDGCSHGYNPMIVDSYTPEQNNIRRVDGDYIGADGTEIFEVFISTYYGIDYDNEFSEEVDVDGLIELANGNKVVFDTVKRNGFDTLQIWLKTESGKIIEIVAEELA
jgi:hypothetical protein